MVTNPRDNNFIGESKYSYPVVEAPNFSHRDPIVMESLDDLKRLCFDFNLPLLYILHGKIVYNNHPDAQDTVYSIYFTSKDGLYYVVYEIESVEDEIRILRVEA